MTYFTNLDRWFFAWADANPWAFTTLVGLCMTAGVLAIRGRR